MLDSLGIHTNTLDKSPARSPTSMCAHIRCLPGRSMSKSSLRYHKLYCYNLKVHRQLSTSEFTLDKNGCSIIYFLYAVYPIRCCFNMMTSSNKNIFRVTRPLCGEFTGHRWIPRTKASEAELWCYAWTNGWANYQDAVDLRRHRGSLWRYCNESCIWE